MTLPSPTTTVPSLPESVSPPQRIGPRTGRFDLGLRDLWAFRELVAFLTWRDVTVRYKQTVLGAMWAILQPILTMVVFTLFFGRLAKMPSDGVPYPIFAYTALVPWTFFSFALTQSSNSIVAASGLVKKIYFPRLIIPLSSVLSAGVDFILAFAVLLGMLLWYGIPIEARIVVIPVLLVLLILSALAAGLWLSALNVQYRDVKFVLPFLSQLWMFATPVAYPASLLDEPWRTLFGLNPMTGVIEGFRWAILGTSSVAVGMLAVSTMIAVLSCFGGALYFRHIERTMADLV